MNFELSTNIDLNQKTLRQELDTKLDNNETISFAEFMNYQKEIMMQEIKDTIKGRENDHEFVTGCQSDWIQKNSQSFREKYGVLIKKAA